LPAVVADRPNLASVEFGCPPGADFVRPQRWPDRDNHRCSTRARGKVLECTSTRTWDRATTWRLLLSLRIQSDDAPGGSQERKRSRFVIDVRLRGSPELNQPYNFL